MRSRRANRTVDAVDKSRVKTACFPLVLPRCATLAAREIYSRIGPFGRTETFLPAL
jgi:hypothetical protein